VPSSLGVRLEAIVSRQNKELILRVEEAWNRGDLDALDEFFAPDVVSHAAVPRLPRGLSGWKQAHRQMLAAVPDRQVTIEDMIAEGDRVVVRARLTGTNLGGLPWAGVTPNGNRIDMEYITIYRIDGGKIVECWALNDMMTLIGQIGADPDLVRRRVIRGGWPLLADG
jgi:predicted ester cyclase